MPPDSWSGAQALDGAVDRGLALGRVGHNRNARADGERRAVEAHDGHEEGVVGRGDARLDKLLGQPKQLLARELDLLAGEVAVGVRRVALAHAHAAAQVDDLDNVDDLALGILEVGQRLGGGDLDERDARVVLRGRPAEHTGLRMRCRDVRLADQVGEEVKVAVALVHEAEAQARRLHRGRGELDAARLFAGGLEPVRGLAAALGVELGRRARRQAELGAVLGRRVDDELEWHVVGGRLHGKVAALKGGLAVALRKQVALALDVVAREHKVHREDGGRLRAVAAHPRGHLDRLRVRLLVDGLQARTLARRGVEFLERLLRLLDRLVLALVGVAIDGHVGVRQRAALEARQLARDARRGAGAVGEEVGKVPLHARAVKGERHLVGAELGRLRGGLERLLGHGDALRRLKRALVAGLHRGLLVERILELFLKSELGPGGLVGGDREARVGAHLVRLGRVVQRVLDLLAGASRGDGGPRLLVELDRLRLAVVGGVGRGEERAVAAGQRAVADQRGRARWVAGRIDGHCATLRVANFGNVAFFCARTSARFGSAGSHRVRLRLRKWVLFGMHFLITRCGPQRTNTRTLSRTRCYKSRSGKKGGGARARVGVP